MPKVKKNATRDAAAKRSKGAETAKKARPDGSVSAMIFNQVEKLVAGNGISRAAAFRQIAEQTGRKEGTVAVNYYYAARKRGAPLRRPRRARSAARVHQNGAAASAQALLASLAAAIRAQAAELETLRRENKRFAELRQLIARA